MDRKSCKHFILRPATIAIILVFMISNVAPAQSLPPPTSGARIVASEAGDWFWITGFNQITLNMSIFASDSSEDPPQWTGEVMPDINGFAFIGFDIHGQDLVPGNFITVSDGMNFKSLILETISMDVFDTGFDVMSGTAPAGRDVWAFAGLSEWQEIFSVTSDPVTGYWLADFTTLDPPFDITEDMRPSSYAQIFDEDGDANEASTPDPIWVNPTMIIFPEKEGFEGLDWPDGNVLVEVVGKQECMIERESHFSYLYGNFGPGCDIVIGDTIRMTGGGITRMYAVQNVEIQQLEKVENIMSGIADAGATVHIISRSQWSYHGDVIAGEDGTWQIDFDNLGIDLVEGNCLRAKVDGALGNATADDSCIPIGNFAVRANEDVVEAYDWDLGTELSLEIDDPATGASPDYTTSGVVTEPIPWDPQRTYQVFDLKGIFDIQPGYNVSVEGGGISRFLHVTDLVITDVDLLENIVSGVAGIGTRVNVWACDAVSCHNRHTFVDYPGIWSIDFDIPGDEGNEQTFIDFIDVTWIDSNQWDDDGDQTMFGVSFLTPAFAALPQFDMVESWDWELDSSIHMTIDDPATPGLIDYEDTGTSAPPEWDPNGRYVVFNFGDFYDLKVGDIVNLTDGVLTRTHTVENLSVTTVDTATEIVAGMADPGKEIIVWPHETGEPLTATADETGLWLIDFNGIFDIQPGDGGRAEIRDGQHNATSIDWSAPKPFLIAFPDYDAVEGWEFPEHETVSLTIDNAPELLVEGPAEVTSWGDPRTEVSLGFSEEYDLVTGDVVTLTSPGILAPINHTVRYLTVSEANMLTETVTGTADPGAKIQVWPHGHDQEATLNTTADESGNWTADFSGTFDLKPGVGGRAQILDEKGNATAFDWNVPFPYFRDDFDGPMADGWYWINENDEMWDFTDPPGSLRIFSAPGAHGSENLLLHPVLPVDFTIETHVYFEPTTDFQFAGLYVGTDDGDFLAFGRAFCDITELCVGNGIYFDYVAGGNMIDGNFSTLVDSPNEAYLRLERRGEMVRGLYSADGIYWIEIGIHWIPQDMQITSVGLTNSQNVNDPDHPIAADFDYFELTEGFGFLPEGFHDFFEGDVLHWDCNAGGWAVDPDDRETDIWVAVDVDGVKLEDWTLANEYRSDLEETGGCIGGSCGFNTSIWDRIDTYEPHQISVFAKDNYMDKWVRLSTSPKQLTCRTFDIYSFDPVTQEIVQISNIRDADEYNPAWSPNGQQVVHHTVLFDGSYGLYITDVKTGESYPLPGAERGGWQSWSPNGRWIIFGRDNNLYLISPSGGTPILVREQAEMASFAPNGKRIVFRDTVDGSIRTMLVDRGKGREINLGVFGTLPEWSPDGNWIVYESGADIWKIAVNMLGLKRSEPIQLTQLYQGEGHPTWSPDGKTIVYHAGLNTPDWDLWSVPAAGGEPTWLNGAPMMGDYDPDYATDDGLIAYAGGSPYGQMPRTWITVYTHDLPPDYWTEGTHTYQFLAEGHDPTVARELNVSINNPRYDGVTLLRQGGIRLQLGEECAFLDGINPSQPTQFNLGWTAEGVFTEAVDALNALMPSASWDNVNSALMMRHEVFPLTQGVALMPYICSYSAGPPTLNLRVNYADNWVESFYEGGHQVDLTITDDVGNIKATATSYTAPRDEWGGAEGFHTTEWDWSSGLQDIVPYDWVYASVDNGITAKVQIGDVSGEVVINEDRVSGTITTSWIGQPVSVECLDWGSGSETPYPNKDGGMILTNGEQEYSCSWAGEWDLQPWQNIGVGYSTPDGHWVANSLHAEYWMAFWFLDVPVGTIAEGEHSYFFEWYYTTPEPGMGNEDPPILPLTVASLVEETPVPIYSNYALLGPWSDRPQQAWTGSSCDVVTPLNPAQPMRFVWGWVNDYSMSYEEALAHFTSFSISVFWDDMTEGRSDFMMSELVPWYGADSRMEFLCGLTEHP